MAFSLSRVPQVGQIFVLPVELSGLIRAKIIPLKDSTVLVLMHLGKSSSRDGRNEGMLYSVQLLKSDGVLSSGFRR